jgi:ankyrin repeat protein
MSPSGLAIPDGDPLALAVVSAIHAGDLARLEQLLRDHTDLGSARIMNDRGGARSLLHIATDWPGHYPNVPATVRALVAAGADVNARMAPHPRDPGCMETPLHWAASSNDVPALDALLDAGADIDAPGAIFTGGSPMSDAVIFAQWNAARRLLERGARTTISEAAALGLVERVERYCASQPPPTAEQITGAFWHACRGGQRRTAEYLLERGAELNWLGWEKQTPLDAARRSEETDLVSWLRSHGARMAAELD